MFSDTFSIFIFFGFFCSILAGNNAEASGIVNLNGKVFGNFDVLNIKINNQNGESESKKIIVNINNLNLNVDYSTRGGIWVYLKSQTNNRNNNEIPKVSVNPSSEKVYNLDTKSLPSFDILKITLSPDVTSLESKKKINVMINDMVIVLDTRNYVALSMKSIKEINNNYNNNNNNNNNNVIINGNDIFISSNNNNNNNGIFFSTSDVNDINTHFHWDGTSFSNFYSESDDFDKKEFEEDMNEMQEDMKTMEKKMRRDAFFDREEFNEGMKEMQEDTDEMRHDMQKDKIFDRGAFNKDMNEMRKNMRWSMINNQEKFRNDMEKMREDMEKMREGMEKMRVNMQESFAWYR
ncbi:hypothetical protein KQX54_012521 [Cotesia glomerata]|uniref:Uncharacterized protein n=2 Tax=Cotesia glomerata TaxID=32391 RepID=A0AAV7IPF0_COTGL|nr:hypothetical protein KQX54_012521 [Cotesia glomerata]